MLRSCCPRWGTLGDHTSCFCGSFIDWSAACEGPFPSIYCPLELNDYSSFPEGRSLHCAWVKVGDESASSPNMQKSAPGAGSWHRLASCGPGCACTLWAISCAPEKALCAHVPGASAYILPSKRILPVTEKGVTLGHVGRRLKGATLVLGCPSGTGQSLLFPPWGLGGQMGAAASCLGSGISNNG